MDGPVDFQTLYAFLEDVGVCVFRSVSMGICKNARSTFLRYEKFGIRTSNHVQVQISNRYLYHVMCVIIL